MSTIFGILKSGGNIVLENDCLPIRHKDDDFAIVAFRDNNGYFRWKNDLAKFLPPNTKIYPLDNSAQDIYTIRDVLNIIEPKTWSKNPCFGRISESAFNELKSLDDLIEKIGKNEVIYFKKRMSHYKEYLKTEIPEFTIEELLKIDMHYQKIKKMYDFADAHDFLVGIEYELRKNK